MLKPLLFLSLLLIYAQIATGQDLQRYEFESQHMGTTFQIILYASSDSMATAVSDIAYARIEDLNGILSDYLPESELSRLSRKSGSGQPIPVSTTLFDILDQAAAVSEQTDGWFDITIGPYTHIWRGLNRMLDPELPSEPELADAEDRVGHHMVLLDAGDQTARLKTEGMRLDPGGIGKGFASDYALQTLRDAGTTRALINAGGDISAGDPPPGKKGWSIAVPVRFDEDSITYEELILSNQSINTSGSLYQSVDIDGKTYSHIINPKTGLGHTEQIQVTAISPDGSVADAYATALNVMPVNEAKELVESKPNLEAVIYRLNKNGATERWVSSGFESFLQK